MTKKAKQTTEDIPKTLSYQDKLKLIVGDKKEVNTIADMKAIEVVPTIFSSFNRAIVAGGAPLRCTYLIHGPSAGGKTAFLMGILHSFVISGHFASMSDAEHALTKEWNQDLKTYIDRILYYQPDSFEDEIDYIDEKMVNFKKLKKDGVLDSNAAFAFGIDVIHKLAPKGEIDELRTDRKGGGGQNINKGWGMRRANMIAAWLNKLTPIVGKENFAFIALAHEKEEDDGNQWNKNKIYVPKGGKELIYESMVRVRITQGKKIYEDGVLVGKEHIGRIEKNKVGHDGEKFRFFIGNGKGSMPAGFDLGMELFEECMYQGVIGSGSSWYEIEEPTGEIIKVQGKEKVMDLFRNDESIYNHYFKKLSVK